jgi:hypothetical protein
MKSRLRMIAPNDQSSTLPVRTRLREGIKAGRTGMFGGCPCPSWGQKAKYSLRVNVVRYCFKNRDAATPARCPFSAKLGHCGTCPARARRTLAGYESAPGLGGAPLVQSLVGIGAKIAQAAAGRRSSNAATRQRRTRRVNNRKSFSLSSEAFAGMRITYRHQKEAQPEGQHDDVQHEVPPCRACFRERLLRVPGRRLRWIKNDKRRAAPNSEAAPRCHVAHLISRRLLRQRYRKVISVGRFRREPQTIVVRECTTGRQAADLGCALNELLLDNRKSGVHHEASIGD